MRVEPDDLPLRPRWSGLNELMRRRVLRPPLRCELCDSEEADRPRFPSASPLRPGGICSFLAGEGERSVDIVETESEEYERDRLPVILRSRVGFRPHASFFLARISSAMPFFTSSSFGTSVESFGLRSGFRSCCVREGRAL
jgi:hypothetical protein